jgi:flavin-binding protein dodecin
MTVSWFAAGSGSRLFAIIQPCPENFRFTAMTLKIKEINNMGATYKLIELVGTSPASFAEAAKAAVVDAAKTVKNMDWFEVVEQRGRIKDGKVTEFQVTIKVGFRVERKK